MVKLRLVLAGQVSTGWLPIGFLSLEAETAVWDLRGPLPVNGPCGTSGEENPAPRTLFRSGVELCGHIQGSLPPTRS